MLERVISCLPQFTADLTTDVIVDVDTTVSTKTKVRYVDVGI